MRHTHVSCYELHQFFVAHDLVGPIVLLAYCRTVEARPTILAWPLLILLYDDYRDASPEENVEPLSPADLERLLALLDVEACLEPLPARGALQ